MKVRLTAYTDRTFKFIIKPPETTWFLRKASGMEKFTADPSWKNIGSVPVQYCYEIAKIKKQLDPDLKNVDIEQILDVGCIVYGR
jgi:large subunit ribosomal protein L11